MAYKILGGIFLVAGAGWGIYIIVAVAMRSEGFTSLGGMIGPLVFHAVSLIIGMILFQLGQRAKKPA